MIMIVPLFFVVFLFVLFAHAHTHTHTTQLGAPPYPLPPRSASSYVAVPTYSAIACTAPWNLSASISIISPHGLMPIS